MPCNRRYGLASLLRAIGLDGDEIVAWTCRRERPGPTATPTGGRNGEAQLGRGMPDLGPAWVLEEVTGQGGQDFALLRHLR